MKYTSTRELFIEAAKLVAARVKIVHKHPLVMRLDFKNGIRIFTHGGKPDFNREHTKKIARDKDLTVRVLEEESLPTPRSHFVWIKRSKFPRNVPIECTDEYQSILAFADKVNYPIFLKPNQGSQGKNVFRISNMDELNFVLQKLLKSDQGFYIAQEACVGDEFRIVVVQGEIVLAYTRKSLSVTGNGSSTIEELFKNKKADLDKRGRGISLKASSEKISLHLETWGLDLQSVPENGAIVTLLSNRNLSDGSEPVECTAEIKRKYGNLCHDVFEKCGIDYCGIDLIEDTRSGYIKPVIIEINSNPGYKHFIRSAPENATLVRQTFVRAIEALHLKASLLRNAKRSDSVSEPSSAGITYNQSTTKTLTQA